MKGCGRLKVVKIKLTQHNENEFSFPIENDCEVEPNVERIMLKYPNLEGKVYYTWEIISEKTYDDEI